MATDATGTPTALGIPTYNVNADAPSGNGFNAAMAEIDTLIQGRILAPSGIAAGEWPVWNGAAWVRSTQTARTVVSTTVLTASSGTYTLPADVQAIMVEAIGGGGGGGGAGPGGNGNGANSAGAGGGAGAYARKLITSPAASYDYVVGGGGAGGIATPTNGTAGGDTYFTAHGGNEAGALCVAKGGGYGGLGSASYNAQTGSSYGLGGAAGTSVGDYVLAGGDGDAGTGMGGGNGSTIQYAKGGHGGASVAGSGGAGTWGLPGVGQTAVSAQSPGAGGGGGAQVGSGWASGGSGANGIIVITEFH